MILTCHEQTYKQFFINMKILQPLPTNSMEDLLELVNHNLIPRKKRRLIIRECRRIIKLTNRQMKRIKLNQIETDAQIKRKDLDGDSSIYDSQRECAKRVLEEFGKNREIINVLILAMAQAGKTGATVAVIDEFLKLPLNHDLSLDPDHIFIITGLSDTDWKRQAKERYPDSLSTRIFHRSQLTKQFVEEIKGKQNVLIIIDEIQIAAQERQTMHKVFTEAGFYNKTLLLQNDIKIVEITATPNGTIYDHLKWKNNATKIQLLPGPGYVGCIDLLTRSINIKKPTPFLPPAINRIQQYKDLVCYDGRNKTYNDALAELHIDEIGQCIEHYYDEPCYHIVRIPNGDNGDRVSNNIKNRFDDAYKYIDYFQNNKSNLNDVLKKPPEKHTIIFIKEKFRCAKTIIKKYLGIVYDRYTNNPDDSVIIQGLLGRIGGYDDIGKTMCFTNQKSVKEYKKLWESNFEDLCVRWRCNTTKTKHKKLTSTGTYHKRPLGENEVDDDDDDYDVECAPFTTFIDAKEWFKVNLKRHLKGWGPKDPSKKINTNGFYEAVIGRKRGKDVYSFEEIHAVRKWGLDDDHRYTFHPCYVDVNDSTTLRFCISWKKIDGYEVKTNNNVYEYEKT